MTMKNDTYEFVRNTGRDRYFAARDREIEMLQDSSGNIKKELADYIDHCPVCGSIDFDLFFKKQGFSFNCCSNEDCKHTFANPQIKEDALYEAYRGRGGESKTANDLWIEVLLSEENRKYDTGKFNLGLDEIEKNLDSLESKSLLDIGCSIGHFLLVARDRGWDTVGLELNEKAVDYARNVKNLDVRTQLLGDAGFSPNSFDAITMWGVIEHLKKPGDVINDCYKLLKPGGILLTFCPNALSLVCRVLREKAATFDGRNHPSYFSPRSIKYLMAKSGLTNVAMTFAQPDLDAVMNYIEGRDPYIKTNALATPLTKFVSGETKDKINEYILAFELGYKMMTVNKKIV